MNYLNYDNSLSCAENIMVNISLISPCTLNSSASSGLLVDFSTIDAIKESIRYCINQSQCSDMRSIPNSDYLIEYLEHIQHRDGKASKLHIQLTPDQHNLLMIPMKKDRALLHPWKKSDRHYIKSHHQRLINDKDFESYTSYSNIRLDYKLLTESIKSGERIRAYAETQKATGNAIAGHGSLEKDYKEFKLPKRVTLYTYRIQGQSMDDEMGINIESGNFENIKPEKVFKQGNLVPDYIIAPPDDKINCLKGSITIPIKAPLSRVINAILSSGIYDEQEEIALHLATCQSYITTDYFTNPKKNIQDRIDILENELKTIECEFGPNLPKNRFQYLQNSYLEVLGDAAATRLYISSKGKYLMRQNRAIVERLNRIQEHLGKFLSAECPPAT